MLGIYLSFMVEVVFLRNDPFSNTSTISILFAIAADTYVFFTL